MITRSSLVSLVGTHVVISAGELLTGTLVNADQNSLVLMHPDGLPERVQYATITNIERKVNQ